MRITEVEAVAAELPFREPFVVRRGDVPSKRHVFVRIATDDGREGWGEASPFLFYAPETAADVLSMVQDHLADDLIGRDPRDIRAILGEWAEIDGHHFAKAAVETALWDLLGQAAGVPLYRLLGGAVRPSVPVAMVLHVDEPAAMAAEARQWVDRGFDRLKLKLGFCLDRDEAMVAAVRKAVGTTARLRVDAEEGYTVKEALALHRRLERFDLELTSQPVPRDDWAGMARLRAALPMSLLADEGIVGPADVGRCIETGAADMVNIKVLKAGGVLPSLTMAALCEAAHLPVVLGSMIESGLGSTLAAHLGLALPIVHSTELIGPLLYADDVLTEPVRIERGAFLVKDAPGLGVTVDRDRLERLRVA